MKRTPLVSIVLPIRNEAHYIEASLNAVKNQNYPSDLMEILIVDGMSTDGTRKIVNNLINRFTRMSIRVIDNPQQIVPTGLNIGIRQARGDIIIRVDGHCEIAPDYVERCVQHLIHEDISGVGGPIETVGETLLAQTISVAMSSSFGVGGSAFRTIDNLEMMVDTIAFPAYIRKTIQDVGLFDEELVRNQDDEYNYRIRKLGRKLLLTPDIRSRYYSRASLGKLWKQYYQYGYWKVRVFQKHPRQMRLRQFIPPLFVASLLLSFFVALSIFIPYRVPYLFIKTWYLVPCAYLLTNCISSIFIASKRGWSYLPLLPIIFTILHVSYGLGFLVGLVRFAHRWRDKIGMVPMLDSSKIDPEP